jgi:hypothetical protein
VGDILPKLLTKKQCILMSALRDKGRTNVKVWWEPWRKPMEMCGIGGGWMAESDEHGVEPLGLSFAEARATIEDDWVKDLNKGGRL